MREEKFIFDFGSTVENRINRLLLEGWKVDSNSIRLDCSKDLAWVCVLLYREKGD